MSGLDNERFEFSLNDSQNSMKALLGSALLKCRLYIDLHY